MLDSKNKIQKSKSKAGILSSKKVAIFGLGLMGGSLALAIKGNCRELYGYDPNPGVINAAKNMNLADHVSDEPDETLHNADLVILAAPVQKIIELIKIMPDIHNNTAIIMDIGSTKKMIVRAYESLPERFIPIGGHPICGKEKSSISNAENDLFLNAPFCLTKLERTREDACALVESLVKELGAVPIWLDADVHDKLIASTSHLPYLIAITLALSTPQNSSILVGPGFRDTGRLAGSDINMMTDILVTNRAYILESLDKFGHNLQKIKETLEKEDYSELRNLLIAGSQSFDKLKKG